MSRTGKAAIVAAFFAATGVTGVWSLSLTSLMSDITQKLGGAGYSAPFFILMAFLAGVFTSLSPCMYPMIPITAGILQGGAGRSLWASFGRAFSYVNGIALVYAFLGFISAQTAILFGSWFSSPWFTVLMVFFFLYLAGSLLGFYDMFIPEFFHTQAASVGDGSAFKCFLMGMLSGSFTSPCVAPPLAIIISFVAKHGNPGVGFIALYAFALGMGSLLLLVGTFSGAMSLLPRAGEWLFVIKEILGFGVLAIAASFLKPFVGVQGLDLLYGIVSFSATAFFGYQFWSKRHEVGAMKGVYCVMSLVALAGVCFQVVKIFM